VPASLQVVNLFNGFSQVGWGIFGFGMIFFWAFVMNADLSFITFRGEHPTVDGKVTEVVETGASVNHSRVRANRYEYSVAGTRLTGTSYTTGSSVSQGDSVTVEYDADAPARSRIEGMRRALFGPGLTAVGILPLVGLLLLVPATLTGLKRNRLLRDGLLANAKLISKQPTNMTVNDRPVYELCFEFMARDGQRQEMTVRTSSTQRLEDEGDEPLLYDPADPSRAYLLDEAPARPELELTGELRGNSSRAVRVLVLPAIVIAVQSLIAWIKLT
jgi:hypothetical protein